MNAALTPSWLDPRFAVAPQLLPGDLPKLKAAGFAGLVNNRPDDEEDGQPSSAELAEAARRLGLGYTHIPVVPGSLADSDARALGDFVGEAGGPVLGFCRTGNRSANLWRRSRELAAGG